MCILLLWQGEPRFTCVTASLSDVGRPEDDGSGDGPIRVKKAKKRKRGSRKKADDGSVPEPREGKMVKPPTSRDSKTVSFSRRATSEGAGEGKMKPLVTSKGNMTGGSGSGGGGKAKGGKKKKGAKRRG